MPNLEKSEFTHSLILNNSPELQSFKEWIFYPGMLFNSMDKWWDNGQRENPHEGLDLCFYKDQRGNICRLDENAKIPAAFDGTIAGIINDFLGRSIIIEHDTNKQTGSFCTIFGHVIPEKSIAKGSTVNKGEVFARLAGTGNSKTKILPHLHITTGYLSGGFSYSDLNWNNISDLKIFTLKDPIQLLSKNYLGFSNI
jgi:murein DD-endopeptidase MepM/ murein hydrolase activator NlpD